MEKVVSSSTLAKERAVCGSGASLGEAAAADVLRSTMMGNQPLVCIFTNSTLASLLLGEQCRLTQEVGLALHDAGQMIPQIEIRRIRIDRLLRLRHRAVDDRQVGFEHLDG